MMQDITSVFLGRPLPGLNLSLTETTRMSDVSWNARAMLLGLSFVVTGEELGSKAMAKRILIRAARGRRRLIAYYRRELALTLRFIQNCYIVCTNSNAVALPPPPCMLPPLPVASQINLGWSEFHRRNQPSFYSFRCLIHHWHRFPRACIPAVLTFRDSIAHLSYRNNSLLLS